MIRPRHDPPPMPEPPAAEVALPAAWTVDRLPPELEYFRTSEAYRVELDVFQGPLDLLLYLIQKDQVDIYDIPISRITDQFLKYIEVMHLLSLDNAGDFIVMAATLLRIKAQLLLPAQTEEEVLEEDPRAELVRRLLEYKRYKEAAAALREREEERRRYHLRAAPYPYLGDAPVPPLRVDIFELLSALAGIVDRLQSPRVHAVVREPYTIEQKIELIRTRLRAARSLHFQELFAEDAIRMEVVVTFMALLELTRRGEISFWQSEPRGAIWIRVRRKGEADEADGAVETAPEAADAAAEQPAEPTPLRAAEATA